MAKHSPFNEGLGDAHPRPISECDLLKINWSGLDVQSGPGISTAHRPT